MQIPYIVDQPEEQIKALDAYRKKHGGKQSAGLLQRFIPPKTRNKTDFLNHPAFGSSKALKVKV